MQQSTLLPKVTVRGFAPQTAGKKVIERKKVLRRRIEESITDLDEARANCRDKHLSLSVVFSLFGSSTEEGRKKKDLDNLLKLLLDVLFEYMVAKGSPNRESGVGLISDDDQVYKIHCMKKIVSDPAEEGIDLEIAEALDRNQVTRSTRAGIVSNSERGGPK